MSLIVQKYGGSSVATPALIQRVAKRVVTARRAGNDLVVVVSAMGKTTDGLVALAEEITDRPSNREMDMLLSSGERISMTLLSMAIGAMGCEAISLTGSQCGIITDTAHRRARIMEIKGDRIVSALSEGKVVIVAGFQGVSLDREVTTLGRGGSDRTAVALAYRLKAELCEIYTDVDGVFTADPRLVPNARKLDTISSDEMLELASSGAKVMEAKSVEFANKYNVTIHVRSSFNEQPGTIIKREDTMMEQVLVRGIAHELKEAKVTFRGVPDQPGVVAEIFSRLSDANVNVDMIVQNVSESGITDVSFTVQKADIRIAIGICEGVRDRVGAKNLSADEEIAKVSVIGVGMRSHSGVAAKMFQTLADEKINIEMISTSEIRISCVIQASEVERAVCALHAAFELEEEAG
ncbi:MAG: aspartate kinase [Candidatus Latescibacteria bacterium]|nr:aspartate kinase [Candidatus Latescibacterota bacterium]MCK5526097.1 aspartate kinase [Candidatus Latescibacterota bacterium]MCK5734251.1 aspartate kinase [Candidatus Latescibacterota bacterium]